MSFDKFSKHFKLFRDTEAEIAVMVDYDDYTNTVTLKKLSSVTGDLQPCSGELAQKEYGLSAQCQYVFYTDRCEDIKAGVYFIISGKRYEAVNVLEWDMGLSVILREVHL